MNDGSSRGNVVLVHGGFVDGSGWQGVYDALKADRYNVAIAQHATLNGAISEPAWRTKPSDFIKQAARG